MVTHAVRTTFNSTAEQTVEFCNIEFLSFRITFDHDRDHDHDHITTHFFIVRFARMHFVLQRNIEFGFQYAITLNNSK